MKTLKLSSLIILLSTIYGCSTTPPAIVHQSGVVHSQSAKNQREANGAIFQAASYRPLFEDVKARMVGDVLTIAISENTSATKAAGASGSKSGSAAFAAPTILGIPATTTAKASISTSASTKFDEKGAETASNSFTGTIAATVIEVLPNGNLLVSGEKQIAFNKGAEFVRFSGVVNPQTITAANQVSSTQVADARFEYRSTSRVDLAEVNSLLTRFFLSVLPF
ncbi:MULTISPECIES: flagellar basal body L-ring protein FlgH [Undibacterium]|jgi:flagellar L-ring protein precursor FlgH|uniref:Flagellar L-ring protein n=2 Tax=Undibacterium TaxID=401469 RepID=A0A941DDC8_9BURK|nr:MULTISPECIES: flagellar basal body L-ring protein FlgH [Undibacterium]MBR7745395.1 flagellar basal body L-ring protein FlgH [Undibacterium baiyunense]GGX00880.1 flagellar L-ring protein [Undibacterium macrobrachii]